jgi:hypothetical protein
LEAVMTELLCVILGIFTGAALVLWPRNVVIVKTDEEHNLLIVEYKSALYRLERISK